MSLEEIDCEFIARDRRGAAKRVVGDVLECQIALKRACASKSSTKQHAGEEARDSQKSIITRAAALKRALTGFGALSARTIIDATIGADARGASEMRAAMAWHGAREILACADEGGRCVVRDVERLQSDDTRATQNEDDGSETTTTLRHRAHGRCASMAWRPRSGRTLALGGASGVSVWTRERRGTRATSAVASETGALSPIDSAKIRALANSGTSGEKAGHRWRLTIYNERGAHEAGPNAPPGGACEAERVAWSPDGRLLVACSRRCRVIHCWDASAGTYTPIGAGVAGLSEVAFSACGGYLLAAHVGEGFTVWKLDDMTCRKWCTNGREVTAVTWGEVNEKQGSAPVALIATRGSAKLSAVHLSSRDSVSDVSAHVLPIELPEIVTTTGSSGSNECDIADMDWDATSSRLALALRGGARDGCVAVYATRTTKIVSGSLIGYFAVIGDDAGDRIAANAVKISAPRRVGSGRVRSTLAVVVDSGDVALVPLTYAVPHTVSTAS